MRKTILTISLLLLALFSNGQALVADEKKALLDVVVTDFKGNPKADEAVIFASEKSGKTVKKTTGADGTFKILLPKGDTYHIRYKSLIGEKQSSSIEVPDEPGIMEATLTVQMESMANEVFELDIHFETDKATIKPESYGLLNDLVEQMQKKPALSIEITGHTDDVGEAGYNQALSERRATSVRDYMASKGISANRIKTQGKGESQPKVTNNSDVNRAINRRTEVRILSGWD